MVIKKKNPTLEYYAAVEVVNAEASLLWLCDPVEFLSCQGRRNSTCQCSVWVEMVHEQVPAPGGTVRVGRENTR